MQRAIASIGRAEAEIAIREAEHNLARNRDAPRRRISSSARPEPSAELERRTRPASRRRRADHRVRSAARGRSQGGAKDAAEAQVAQIEATLEDMMLRTPVAGRVEYKLVQAGEVVAAGGRLVTMLDLTDVFMTIFLPTGEAGRVALGSEARIVLDAAPNYVFPATVSFVAAEAQFTPKTVETANEREKLMYRVKLAIDPKLLETYRDYVKAGLTGNAYVQVACERGLARPGSRRGCPMSPADAGSRSRCARVTHRYGSVDGARATSRSPIPPGTDHRASSARMASASRRCSRSIAGVRRLQSGNDPHARRRHAARARIATASSSRIAYMPQGLGRNLYPTLSVLENIDFFGRLFGQAPAERRARIDAAAARDRARSRFPTARPASSPAA